MTKLIDYLAEPETAVVFDIDGVLCVYEFGDLSHSACPDDDWESYVVNQRPYDSALPVPVLQRFIQEKGPDRVFACSVAEDYEASGKLAFVTRNYAIPADHVRLVSSKPEKRAFLEELRDGLGLPEQRVALVEDTVKTLDALSDGSAFTTVHVTSFFA
ncbi:hypothetical protein [Slackia heliotrinireducens]|uniref:hypothetical protein n=1 Tax=Slackia heliotrinireducens TaxID=84110 RepID=UPI003315357E